VGSNKKRLHTGEAREHSEKRRGKRGEGREVRAERREERGETREKTRCRTCKCPSEQLRRP